jgi:chromosomal replication initiator protein
MFDNNTLPTVQFSSGEGDSFVESFKDLWEITKTQISEKIDHQVFQAYFSHLRFAGFNTESSEIEIACPSKLVLQQIQNNYLGLIVHTIKNCLRHFPIIERSNFGLSFYVDTRNVDTQNRLTSPPLNPSPFSKNHHQSVTFQEKNIPIMEGAKQNVAKSSSENISVITNTLSYQNSPGIFDSTHPNYAHQSLDAATKKTRSSNFVSNYESVIAKYEASFSQPFSNSISRRNETFGFDRGQRSSSYNAVNSNINSKYVFDSFVVGNSNQFCHAAALRVAENPGMSYNPLFIYGGVGLGKTHLLHSIGNEVLKRNPNANILYLSSEAFTNELIMSLRNAKMDEFKQRLRNIEVLLIDDIQFICGKERTQEEFFHTFNALYSAKRQIVLTSDKIPSEIPGIEERLQTRFSWGLTADLQAPDFETRVAILKRKAHVENFTFPEEVAHFIAEQISSNVRELEGALTRLHAASSLQGVPITLKSAALALQPLLQPKIVNITVDDIKKAVASHFNIKVSDIVSKSRTKTLSFPRHIAMYLCRKHTTASYPEIGGQFGGRDHSSVIHAASVVTTKLSNDLKIREIIEEIEKKIFG